jgi:hypothetical protein
MVAAPQLHKIGEGFVCWLTPPLLAFRKVAQPGASFAVAYLSDDKTRKIILMSNNMLSAYGYENADDALTEVQRVMYELSDVCDEQISNSPLQRAHDIFRVQLPRALDLEALHAAHPTQVDFVNAREDVTFKPSAEITFSLTRAGLVTVVVPADNLHRAEAALEQFVMPNCVRE